MQKNARREVHPSSWQQTTSGIFESGNFSCSGWLKQFLDKKQILHRKRNQIKIWFIAWAELTRRQERRQLLGELVECWRGVLGNASQMRHVSQAKVVSNLCVHVCQFIGKFQTMYAKRSQAPGQPPPEPVRPASPPPSRSRTHPWDTLNINGWVEKKSHLKPSNQSIKYSGKLEQFSFFLRMPSLFVEDTTAQNI